MRCKHSLDVREGSYLPFVSGASGACMTPEEHAGGSNRRNVEYCEVPLDGAVLAQSLADTAAIVARDRESREGEEERTAPSSDGAPRCAIAILLERDDSDDDGAEGLMGPDAPMGALSGVVVVKECAEPDGAAVRGAHGAVVESVHGDAVEGLGLGRAVSPGAVGSDDAGSSSADVVAEAVEGATRPQPVRPCASTELGSPRGPSKGDNEGAE